MLIDMDSNPHAVHFTNLVGDSYSHTWQAEATYPLFEGFTITATYRRTNVKATYGGILREKPLTNRYKGLVTAQYKPGLGKWQFDATLQLNGGGRMPDPYTTADGKPSWDSRYKGYEQVSAQVTRFFRHWSIYAGGENITARRQKHPIIAADDLHRNKNEFHQVLKQYENKSIIHRIDIGCLLLCQGHQDRSVDHHA